MRPAWDNEQGGQIIPEQTAEALICTLKEWKMVLSEDNTMPSF
jgi:hypothetical protein